MIVEIYYGYVHMSYIFKFFLSFTQFDFVLINALSDMAMKIYSYSSYMENKTFLVTSNNNNNETPDSEKLIENMQEHT